MTPSNNNDWEALRQWIEAKRLSLTADRHDPSGLESVWISGQESLLTELAELIKEK
jgi:hypothetical protein